MDSYGLGKILLLVGVTAVISGGVFMLIGKSGLRIPGNFEFQRGNFRFYFPIGASIVLSIVLTLIFNVLLRNR